MDYKAQLKQSIVDRFGEPHSLDELGHTIIKVIEDTKIPYRCKPKHHVLGFGWDISMSDIHCSHDAPIGAKTNWGSKDKTIPTHYKGFGGRVWIRYDQEVGSDGFSETLTYPGTGGWGSYNGPFDKICNAHYSYYGVTKKKGMYPEPKCYSWDYRFYLDDWELHDVTMNILKGNDRFSHSFRFYDQETADKDAEFMESIGK